MPLSTFSRGAVIVAGGSGGIGRVICQELARSGVDVGFSYHSNSAGAEETLAAITAEGRRGWAHKVALEDIAAARQFADSVNQQAGGIHSLVYAAGPKLTFGYTSRIDPDVWKRAFDVDVNGCFNLVSAAMPYLKENDSSALVAVITAAVEKVPSQDILSAAPKAAIEMLMRGIALEEGRYGVRANCVAPGFIDAGQGGDLLTKPGGEAFVDGLRRGLPLKRFGTAQDIADAAIFLLSDKAKYITGQSLAVDGGLQL